MTETVRIVKNSTPWEQKNKQLIKEYSNGNKDALTDILLLNTGLVKKVIASINSKLKVNVPFDDLYQEGMCGLIRAVETYDENKNTALSTHAWYWISHYIFRYIENNNKNIRFPSYLQIKFTKVSKYEEKIQKEENRIVKDEEIIQECGLTKNELIAYRSYISTEESIDTTGNLFLDTKPYSRNDFYKLIQEEEKNKEIYSLEVRLSIESELKYLKKIDQKIVKMRHGLFPYEKEMTFSEIGVFLNLTSTRVRQRYVESLNRLSHQEGIRMLA